MITLLGIPFDFQGLSYYRTDKNIEIGEQVIVKTDHGTYLGTVKKMRVATEETAPISTRHSHRLNASPLILTKR